MKPLIVIIPWKKTIWICGFLKTMLSSSLISTGVILIFNGVTNHPLFNELNEIPIICGFASIVFAVLIVIIIDKYKEKTKKEELEAIDKQIDDKAKRIAEEKILEYLKKIEKD